MMKLTQAKQIQIEAHRLVASVENDEPAPVIATNLIAIMSLCQAAFLTNAVPAFFVPDLSDEPAHPKHSKGNAK